MQSNLDSNWKLEQVREIKTCDGEHLCYAFHIYVYGSNFVDYGNGGH